MQYTIREPRLNLTFRPEVTLETVKEMLERAIFDIDSAWDEDLTDFERDLLRKIKALCISE